MRFRNLLAAVSVFVVCFTPLCFAAQPEASTSPAVFVRGLMMLQLEQKDGLHIVLPDAPGHQATITFVMKDGTRHVIPFKGHSVIKTSEAETSPAVVKVPELIRMKELFGSGFTPRLDHAPNSVLIPWSSIRTVTTSEISPFRYMFVRKDNGEEIETFRPRNVAETVRIQLSSLGQLDFNPLKSDIEPGKVKEIWIEQVPKRIESADMYREHFHHYLQYISRLADQNFDVEPRKLSGAPSYTPRVGNSFWVDAIALCAPCAID